MKRKTINLHLKTGTYHIPSLEYDHNCFFGILEKYNQECRQINTRDDDEDPEYIYRILFLEKRKDYILLSLNRINKKAIEESANTTSNAISQMEIDNHLEGFVFAYMDTDNNIIIDNNRDVSISKFIKIITRMIDRHLTFEAEDDRHHGLTGKKNFEISFDRLNHNHEFEQFYAESERIISIDATARVQSNPIRSTNESIKQLEKQFVESGYNKISLNNKGSGAEKDTDMVHGFRELAKDGHYDVLMKGRDAVEAETRFSSKPKDDDIHDYKKVAKELSEFERIAKELVETTIRKRSLNTEDKVSEGPDGDADKDDQIEN